MKIEAYDQGDKEAITALLVGRTVTKIDDSTLLLDNGTRLKLEGNNGGCSCGSGDYELTHLASVDNVITNVRFVDSPSGDGYEAQNGSYSIFVFAGDQQINLATFEGTDGNGWYGTGYWIRVEKDS